MARSTNAAIILLLACTYSVSGADKQLNRQKRVIGGTTVDESDRPWLVSLRGKIVTERLFGLIPIRHRYVHCGGSLINDRWVLTAAHCFDGGRDALDIDAWEVRLAVSDLKVALADRFMDLLGQMLGRREWLIWEVGVSSIIIHPQYDRYDKWYKDIALVRLNKAVPTNSRFDNIRRIELPTGSDINFPPLGTVCSVLGWGCTSHGGGISRHAMSIDLPILASSLCQTYYSPRNMDGRICAGFNPNTDEGGICPGDSGGPLVCQDGDRKLVQVGVASFTSRHNPESFPAVFTRVTDNVPWINFYVFPTRR